MREPCRGWRVWAEVQEAVLGEDEAPVCASCASSLVIPPTGTGCWRGWRRAPAKGSHMAITCSCNHTSWSCQGPSHPNGTWVGCRHPHPEHSRGLALPGLPSPAQPWLNPNCVHTWCLGYRSQHLSLQIPTAPLLTHTWAACKFNLPLFRCIHELSTEWQRCSSFILMVWETTVSIEQPLVFGMCWECSMVAPHLCLLLSISALP